MVSRDEDAEKVGPLADRVECGCLTAFGIEVMSIARVAAIMSPTWYEFPDHAVRRGIAEEWKTLTSSFALQDSAAFACASARFWRSSMPIAKAGTML